MSSHVINPVIDGVGERIAVLGDQANDHLVVVRPGNPGSEPLTRTQPFVAFRTLYPQFVSSQRRPR